MKLTAIITDDEELARENLKIQLRKIDANIDIVAEAKNGKEALALIEQHKPDLVFLDIQMPVMTGFDVTQNLLLAGELPAIVFTTAYDQYALKAFEIHAVDYLLKPIGKDRLKTACDRVAERLAAKSDVKAEKEFEEKLLPHESELLRLVSYLNEAAAKKQTETSGVHQSEPKLTGLTSKVRGNLVVIKLDDINHITADDKVNFIHTDAGEFITDFTLDDLEKRLDPSDFMRIHRSHIVNIKKVKTLVPWFAGKFKVILNDKAATELSLSRFRLDEMRKRLLW
jgi:two-component system LytT family response regulator